RLFAGGLVREQSVAQQRLLQTSVDLQSVLVGLQRLARDPVGLLARLAPLRESAAQLRVADQISGNLRVALELELLDREQAIRRARVAGYEHDLTGFRSFDAPRQVIRRTCGPA